MSYTHLSSMERAKIELLQEQGLSPTAVARKIGRHRTTIKRELRRNSGALRDYRAHTAQVRYTQRRRACRPKGKLSYEPLREYVAEQMALGTLSPELVAGRIKLDFPHDPRMRVSHESIYQAIYTPSHYLHFLLECLPQARPKRRRRGQGKTRRGPSIPNRVSIDKRPAIVDTRTELGHWEGDLIVGKGQDGFILTLVERVSRLLHTVTLQTKRAAEVCQAVIQALLDRPISWVKTITFDNGSEFSEHERIAIELGVSIYFADPYSAYQRGSNEQVNGLLRRHLPKGTSFKHLSKQTLDTITETINNRPRKCLGYRTPNEVFQIQRNIHYRALRT